MDLAANKKLVRRIMEDGFNKADISVIYECFHPDYVRHGFGLPSAGSLEEHVAYLQGNLDAYTDARFEIHTMVAEADTVVVHYTFHGTHTGELRGVAPTGQAVSRPSAAFFRVADGLVTEGTIISAPMQT